MPAAETISAAPAKVLVVGGSYAGLAATVNLLDLCDGLPPRFAYEKDPQVDEEKKASVEVTIVDERDGFFHLLGMPVACASKEYAEKAWVKFSDIPALQSSRINIVQGKVTSIDAQRKSSTIHRTQDNKPIQQRYDYLIAASGIHREWPSAPTALNKKEYRTETDRMVEQCANATEGIIVVGGGAVGIEMAAEIKMIDSEQKVTLVHSRQKLLSSESLADLYKDKVLELVHEAGVETVLGSRVKKTEKSSSGFTVTLENGNTLKASVVIDAVSRFSPRHPYLPQDVLDEKGYVKITPSLNLPENTPNSKYHYAAGDIVRWTGIKRAGAAMHHGHLVARNIHQNLMQQIRGTTPEYSELTPAEPGMCVAIGKKAAAYSDTYGLKEGEETLKLFFEDDLGFGICWRHMGLGDKPRP
ncbi:MCM DNA helicase complex subunit mcm6 [Ascosphaera pollenicola]|nr:MCM DNA helicase complex subunit mcm6 [Ascosphaera pollenicola]